MAPRLSRSTPDRQPRVLNDRRRKLSSLRREANDSRQRELARGLENKHANVAKSQYLDAWYQSPTSSLFFLAKELERTSLLLRLGTVAPDWRLSSREQHGHLGMCFFVSGERVLYQVYHECEHQDVLLPKQDNYWVKLSTEKAGSKLFRLSRLRSCTRKAYRWVNFGSFAKACHGKSFYSGFLLFLEQQRAHKYYSLIKNQERTTFPSTTSDRQRARGNAKIYLNQRRDEMARTWKHILRHEHFHAKYRYMDVERRFQPLSIGGFSSNQRESISRCPKSPFPSKTQNRQIARTYPQAISHVPRANKRQTHEILYIVQQQAKSCAESHKTKWSQTLSIEQLRRRFFHERTAPFFPSSFVCSVRACELPLQQCKLLCGRNC